MPYLETVTDISPENLSRYDAIIDVRSPAEFEDDHMPGAINLPVLSNAERARVGTIYKQESPFRANRIGGALVARNIAHHLETALADQPKSWRPLVYCWRGGMRSNAMATILSSVGWPSGVVKGGYKTWRREVVTGLDHEDRLLPIRLIDGQTGTGKTALLQAIAEAGGQVIDLEGLAHHRGSAFGDFGEEDQPAQRLFESGIWDQLRRFDLTRPVFVEAESARVGRCRVPRRLWRSMLAAPRIEVRAPADVRADFLLGAYADIIEDPARLAEALARLKGLQSGETLAAWQELAAAGSYRTLAAQLMTRHYDPLYARSRKRREDAPVEVVELESLDEVALAAAARRLLSGH
ncbi:tRNA 2-selenouridine(34) synthase MnmH [Hyphomonas sp.]|uniref:tRNA 2-selenouridine(34) synthase MnmH n=1 Tax=Hyphomonas sp. TaxID=87 RepID=UPI0025BDA9CE|nr:tRNA 2-selenouridine(34) synthase MnmH [Hyphomonas sp.]